MLPEVSVMLTEFSARAVRVAPLCWFVVRRFSGVPIVPPEASRIRSSLITLTPLEVVTSRIDPPLLIRALPPAMTSSTLIVISEPR